MKINTINAQDRAFLQKYEKALQKQPKYNCATCGNCTKNSRCDVFERRVEPDYNRCFYHTEYRPKGAKFKPAPEDKIEKVSEVKIFKVA